MPGPINPGPVVIPFPGQSGAGGRRGPRSPATVTGAAGAATAAGSLIGGRVAQSTWYLAAAYYGKQAWEWATARDWDPFGTHEQAMREYFAKEESDLIRLRKLRLKLEADKAAQAAYEAGELAAHAVILQRVPPPPAPNLIPGTPEYARETQKQVEAARKAAVAAAGGKMPPATLKEKLAAQTAAATPAPLPAAAKKPSLAKRVLASSYFWPTVGLASAFALRTPAAKPFDLGPLIDTPPDLTGFEEQSVFLGGELGGELAFSPEPQTGTEGDVCEKVDPAREPGQCRQGWFSETPKGLYLKEWSRRQCQ